MGNKLLEKQNKKSLQRRQDFERLWPGVALADLSTHILTRTHSTASLLFLSAPPSSHFPDLPVQGGWKETASPLEPWAELCRSELWIIVPQYECLWLIAWDKVCFPPHSSHLYPPPLHCSSASAPRPACLSSHNQPWLLREREGERNYLTDPVISEHDDGCPNYSTITKALI